MCEEEWRARLKHQMLRLGTLKPPKHSSPPKFTHINILCREEENTFDTDLFLKEAFVLVPVREEPAAETGARISDPRLRRHPEAAASAAGPVRQIRITKNPVDVVNLTNSPSDASDGRNAGDGRNPADGRNAVDVHDAVDREPEPAKPSRFSLTLPAKRSDPLKIPDSTKRTFEDWNQKVNLKPSGFPKLPPLPPMPPPDSPKDRSSRDSGSSSRDRSSRDRSSRDKSSRDKSSRDHSSHDRSSRDRSSRDKWSGHSSSDIDSQFGRGPAEAAKRRSDTLSSSKWKVLSRVKEDPPPTSRRRDRDDDVDDPEDIPVKKRFKLHRDRDHDRDRDRRGSSGSRNGQKSGSAIATTEDMFVELMKVCKAKKK